jgi:hypothetical protein
MSVRICQRVYPGLIFQVYALIPQSRFVKLEVCLKESGLYADLPGTGCRIGPVGNIELALDTVFVAFDSAWASVLPRPLFSSSHFIFLQRLVSKIQRAK